jgi:hypothetical protein
MAEHEQELWMSRKDRERVQVLREVRKRHITQEQAGKELGVTARWMQELLRRMKARADRTSAGGTAKMSQPPPASTAGKLRMSRKNARSASGLSL